MLCALVLVISDFVRQRWVYLNCIKLFHAVCVPAWLQVIVFDSKVSVLHAHQYAAFSENSKKAQIQSFLIFDF